MQLPVEYMVKISVCLAVTYMFYYLLLRHTTHYIWNRWFLFACTLLSFIIPAININLFVQPQQLGHIYFINKLPAIYTPGATVAAPESNGINIQLIAFIVFITGVLVLAAKLAIQYLSLKKIQSQAKLVSNGNGEFKLYHLDAAIAPFSFNNNIYCNNKMYNQQELDEVIRHEMVHVTQKHTRDVLLAELLCILNWYNPFAWMIKRAVKDNLEFIADDNVLQHGTSRQGYQYLILKVTGNTPYAIANNLNFSSLKTRIAMMNKNKTSKAHLLKFLFVLPLACCILVAFRHGNAAPVKEEVKTAIPAGDETFTLGTLTYNISNTSVEALVKQEQPNSYLKPGSLLSLSSIKNEKTRLTNLLNASGYDTSGEHAIYFLIDTFSTNKSFSIQININVNKRQLKTSAVRQGTSLPVVSNAISMEQLNAQRTIKSSIIQENNNTALQNTYIKNSLQNI